MTSTTRIPAAAPILTLLAAILLPVSAPAQGAPNPDSIAVPLKAVSVTATRSETDVQNIAAPVAVIDAALMQRRAPANIVELFREMAGLDVIGVGANQLRPSIRGQRGQRVLLLEDGLRLGNTRRQQDFGELPSLVDVTALERVEIVRGPSSVLYGTDAIGGVMNLITSSPTGTTGSEFSGRLGYRYGDAGSSNRGDARLAWRAGGLAVQAGGSLRQAGSYFAPAGSYGNVTLGDDARVQDSGVDDETLNGYVGWKSAAGHGAFLRAEQYGAENSGFGFIEPSLLGGETRIQILYPRHAVSKVTMGANSGVLSSPFVTKASLAVYRVTNGRDLAQNIWAPFGPGTPPGAGVEVQTRNRTDVTTVGFRAEAARIFSSNVITYGADFFRDDARGRDSSVTSVIGFGPPMTEISNRSQIPNATLSSFGLFVQNDMRLHDRFSVVAGGRFQATESKPRSTGSVSAAGVTNSTGVYAVNALFRANGALNLVASVGRGFRAPNLVERYFDGPTPEGSSYQSATPDLKPEQSLNVDLGAKMDWERVRAEVFIFQNRITDGIRIAFAGDSIDGLPRYENVNVAALRVRGAEVSVTALVTDRVTATANWSRLLSRNLNDPALSVGEVFASKANATIGYRAPAGRWWAEYGVRYNGRQRQIVAGTSPVGDELPAFTVHNVRGGLVPWTTAGGLRQELGLQVNNLTNELFAEVANAGFFRPEPRRNLVVTITTWF